MVSAGASSAGLTCSNSESVSSSRSCGVEGPAVHLAVDVADIPHVVAGPARERPVDGLLVGAPAGHRRIELPGGGLRLVPADRALHMDDAARPERLDRRPVAGRSLEVDDLAGRQRVLHRADRVPAVESGAGRTSARVPWVVHAWGASRVRGAARVCMPGMLGEPHGGGMPLGADFRAVVPEPIAEAVAVVDPEPGHRRTAMRDFELEAARGALRAPERDVPAPAAGERPRSRRPGRRRSTRRP